MNREMVSQLSLMQNEFISAYFGRDNYKTCFQQEQLKNIY